MLALDDNIFNQNRDFEKARIWRFIATHVEDTGVIPIELLIIKDSE